MARARDQGATPHFLQLPGQHEKEDGQEQHRTMSAERGAGDHGKKKCCFNQGEKRGQRQQIIHALRRSRRALDREWKRHESLMQRIEEENERKQEGEGAIVILAEAAREKDIKPEISRRNDCLIRQHAEKTQTLHSQIRHDNLWNDQPACASRLLPT